MVSTRRIEEWNDENDRTEMGNSLATRVPKRVANGAGLPKKDAVEIKVRKKNATSCGRICRESIV